MESASKLGDPRRNESLVSFLTSLSLDVESSEAFKQARKGYLLGSTMSECRRAPLSIGMVLTPQAESLSWHFTPWLSQFVDPFWNAITSPYTEVRMAVSDDLRFMSEIRLHPSFTSTDAFLSACSGRQGMRLLNDVDDEYIKRIDTLVRNLIQWRSIRKPFAKDAVQPYDAACLTVLTWLWSGMNDYRITPIYPFVVRLLPELMHMQDVQDNQELQRWAQVVLAALAGLPYPGHLVSPVLEALLAQFKSPSWRTRLAVLPLLQVFFFHQLFSLSEDQIRDVVETLRHLLKDSHVSRKIKDYPIRRIADLTATRRSKCGKLPQPR